MRNPVVGSYTAFALALLAIPFASAAQTSPASHIQVANIGDGIALHFVEMGGGPPIVFIHGSISDLGYWADQLPYFAKRYRAIAYSRRYDYPNVNPSRPGYSAVTDADDLAGLIRSLHLGRVYLVGHSYGALTALFFASKYPQMVRAMVLAEPPAVSLLQDIPGSQHAADEAMYEDIRQRMVAPMTAAFARSDTNAGVAAFIDYVFDNPNAWSDMSQQNQEAALRDAREWQVMMTTGTLFPVISPAAVRAIGTPALIMSGSKSYAFLRPIDTEFAALLPNSQSVTIMGAGHQMWYQRPEECRRDTEAFFARHGGPSLTGLP